MTEAKREFLLLGRQRVRWLRNRRCNCVLRHLRQQHQLRVGKTRSKSQLRLRKCSNLLPRSFACYMRSASLFRKSHRSCRSHPRQCTVNWARQHRRRGNRSGHSRIFQRPPKVIRAHFKGIAAIRPTLRCAVLQWMRSFTPGAG